MSTRGRKQSRRRRTFPVTHRVKQGTLLYPKRRFFGKFDPLMETFLECDTWCVECRKPPPGHVFVESLAEIDPRKVVQVVRLTRHKKTMPLRPIFSRTL